MHMTPTAQFRYRQVHLDFHTSERIPDIGALFEPDRFAAAFKAAHVDSVTVFAKCHHGLSYHPTEVGQMHPGLEFDLLRAQIDALHGAGINAVLYVSATWDELAARLHPEWRTVSPDGSLPRFRADPTGAGWALMDFSTGYLDYLAAQVDEVMRVFADADGLFMDISWQSPSISESAKAWMERLGLEWTRAEDRERFTAQSVQTYFDRITGIVRETDPGFPLFFNAGHIRRGLRSHYARHYSHLEVESLPTAGWGYEHFPLSARYAEGLGLPVMGMTGKFHFHWGEIGGYKTADALTYECAAMLAQGAACSVGDHLHPSGAVDASTMRIIAAAYTMVEEAEPWCRDTRNQAEIGLISVEATQPVGLGRLPVKGFPADEGAVRVLLESKFTFDVLDLESDFSAYPLLILPDEIAVDAALAARLMTYRAAGGRLLLTGQSGLGPDGFVLNIGADWHGTSPMTGGDYVLPIAALRAEGIDSPLFMYQPSERITVADRSDALGLVFDPYLDRTPKAFSGHVNAPPQLQPNGFSAGVCQSGVTYFAWPIFTCYHQTGAVAMLDIAERLIDVALGRDRLVRMTLPTAGRVTVRRQPPQNRLVVHLLHANPVLRGRIDGVLVQPIQDLVTLHDVSVSVRLEIRATSVRLVPSGDELAFEQSAGRVDFVVPRLRGNQMVEIAYRSQPPDPSSSP